MLRTLTLAYSWAIILSFFSRVIASLFSPEAGDRDGCFVDTMRGENTKHGIQRVLAAQWTVECGLFTLPIITSEHHAVQEKKQNPKSQGQLLPNMCRFYTIVYLKNLKSDHLHLEMTESEKRKKPTYPPFPCDHGK